MEEPHPLFELRDRLDLTQQQLADAIGRSRSYVAQIEARHEEIGKETVLLLFDHYRGELDALGISAEELLRGKREPDPEEDEHGVVRRARK